MAKIQGPRRPVVNRDKRLAGILSLGDLALADGQAEAATGRPVRHLGTGRPAHPGRRRRNPPGIGAAHGSPCTLQRRVRQQRPRRKAGVPPAATG